MQLIFLFTWVKILYPTKSFSPDKNFNSLWNICRPCKNYVCFLLRKCHHKVQLQKFDNIENTVLQISLIKLMHATFSGHAVLWFLSILRDHFSTLTKKKKWDSWPSFMDWGIVFIIFCVWCKLSFSEAKITVAKASKSPECVIQLLFLFPHL